VVLLRLVETHANDSSADMWPQFGEMSNGRHERGVQISRYLTYKGSSAHRIAPSERSHHRSTRSPVPIKYEVGFKGARVPERREGHDAVM